MQLKRQVNATLFKI